MEVTVYGPNLRDQSKGTFHAHRTGCQHAARLRGEENSTIDVGTQLDVVDFVYPGDSFEWGGDPKLAGPYLDDIWFAPCLKDLQ